MLGHSFRSESTKRIEHICRMSSLVIHHEPAGSRMGRLPEVDISQSRLWEAVVLVGFHQGIARLVNPAQIKIIAVVSAP